MVHQAFNVVLIGLIGLFSYWTYRRRSRRATVLADLWFKEIEAGYIFQPYGRFGRAYLVSPDIRALIVRKRAAAIKASIIALIVMLFGPVLLLVFFNKLYLDNRSAVTGFRMILVFAFIPAYFIWDIWSVRPLYAGCPAANSRIGYGDVSAKQAKITGWGMIVFRVLMLVGIGGLLLYQHSGLHGSAIGTLLGAFLFLYLIWATFRVAMLGRAKFRLRQ